MNHLCSCLHIIFSLVCWVPNSLPSQGYLSKISLLLHLQNCFLLFQTICISNKYFSQFFCQSTFDFISTNSCSLISGLSFAEELLKRMAHNVSHLQFLSSHFFLNSIKPLQPCLPLALLMLPMASMVTNPMVNSQFPLTYEHSHVLGTGHYRHLASRHLCLVLLLHWLLLLRLLCLFIHFSHLDVARLHPWLYSVYTLPW